MVLDDLISASDEELAEQILTNSDHSPLRTAFLRDAAIELATRIRPDLSKQEVRPLKSYYHAWERARKK